ncbi:FeoA family protein [Candidatus Electronema sp. TJ]|uniref:FeoA family protein n=1 Tax=Candidatus Electronema sp. TJ TaxID=3401573 RepID=UPI003AA7D7DE
MIFHCLFGRRQRQHGQAAEEDVRPLSQCCCGCRVKVCRISGDRSVCGRMASLGVLPGAVLELLCPARGRGRRQCMVKINGCTLSLDELAADSIFVRSL